MSNKIQQNMLNAIQLSLRPLYIIRKTAKPNPAIQYPLPPLCHLRIMGSSSFTRTRTILNVHNL